MAKVGKMLQQLFGSTAALSSSRPQLTPTGASMVLVSNLVDYAL